MIGLAMAWPFKINTSKGSESLVNGFFIAILLAIVGAAELRRIIQPSVG
jgi:hypothetical protein